MLARLKCPQMGHLPVGGVLDRVRAVLELFQPKQPVTIGRLFLGPNSQPGVIGVEPLGHANVSKARNTFPRVTGVIDQTSTLCALGQSSPEVQSCLVPRRQNVVQASGQCNALTPAPPKIDTLSCVTDLSLRCRAMGPRRLGAAGIVAATTAGTAGAAGATVRTARAAALPTILAAPTKALPSTAAAHAALAGTRRAHRGQGLQLLGSEDLLQLGLGLFFKRRNLLLLFFGEIQPFHHERRQDMEAAAASATRPARATPRPARSTGSFRTTGTNTFPRRRSARTVLGHRQSRTGSQRKSATRQKEH